MAPPSHLPTQPSTPAFLEAPSSPSTAQAPRGVSVWSGQTRPLLMEAPSPLTPDTTAASLRGSERQRQRSRDLEDDPGLLSL